MKPAAVLIIEDEHALGTGLAMLVRRMGHLPSLAASAAAAAKEVETQPFDAVVLDIGLPDRSGLDLLADLRKSQPNLPVMVITAHATLDHAIGSNRGGATAYLTKPLDLRNFEQTLAALLAPNPLQPHKAPKQATIPPLTATLIGAAPCLRDAFVGIARACASGSPALITGPGGSGKSLAASVIHAHGSRAGKELRILDPRSSPNPFPIPDCGTLVFDEITDWNHSVQSALADWLSQPTNENRPQVLATTSADPQAAREANTLREDLFYCLNTLLIPLPPLRERSADIPALANYFTALRGGSSPPPLTDPVLSALQAYPWPGNVRELRHVLDNACALSRGGPIFLSHLPPHVAEAGRPGCAPAELESCLARWLDGRMGTRETDEPPTYDSLLDELERILLRDLLARFDDRPTRLATALKVHRATLRQKLRRLGTDPDEDG
jgi:DNA-binding NtrC family response regulator